MSYGGGKWGINASCVDERHLLDNQIRGLRGDEAVTICRKRREIFLKCESVWFRMWQQGG